MARENLRTKIIDALIISFDEMGFIPSVLMPAEKAAREWRDNFVNVINDLISENEELRGRLDKAVELKANVGDVVYMPWKYDGNVSIATLRIIGIDFRKGEFAYITDLESDSTYYLAKYGYGIFRNKDFGNIIFTDYQSAEARLTELKGEKVMKDYKSLSEICNDIIGDCKPCKPQENALTEIINAIESGELCDREEVRKETAREILQKLYNETIYFSVQYIIKELAEKYGVEVEA